MTPTRRRGTLGSLAQTTRTSHSGDHLARPLRSLLGRVSHAPERDGERAAGAHCVAVGVLRRQQRVEERLVAELRLTEVLDRRGACRQHPVEGPAVDHLGATGRGTMSR